jgi:N-acetylglutamate synthase-like GNAT family acetyltransferase
MISNYQTKDYESVVALLNDCKVDPPTCPEELFGPCFVAKRDGDLIGCIHVLVGEGSKAYVDFLAIREEWRSSLCLYYLLRQLREVLTGRGIKKIMFHVEKDNPRMVEQLFKRRADYRIRKLNDLHYFTMEILG